MVQIIQEPYKTYGQMLNHLYAALPAVRVYNLIQNSSTLFPGAN